MWGYVLCGRALRASRRHVSGPCEILALLLGCVGRGVCLAALGTMCPPQRSVREMEMRCRRCEMAARSG